MEKKTVCSIVYRYWKGEKEKHKAKSDYERKEKGDNKQNVNVDNLQVTVKKIELNRRIKMKKRQAMKKNVLASKHLYKVRHKRWKKTRRTGRIKEDIGRRR